MPDPISHAEMIAAYRQTLDDQEAIARVFPAGQAAQRLDALRAVLAHLERTQPTDTQADLTERARDLVRAIEFHLMRADGDGDYPESTKAAIAALQSEREATAAAFQSERAQRASAYNQLFDEYQKVAREKEAAAAEARRAAIVAEQIGAEIVSIMETHDQQEAERGVDTPGGLEHMGDVWRLLGRWRDRLASPPAPQEET